MADTPPVTILVVDDDEAKRYSITKILQRAGHTVFTASNGLEGVALFRSSPDLFDIILTDLQMPTMDGHQLVKLVRETLASAKIICMSGYTDKPTPANTEFLRKPFEMNALYAYINKLLHQT